jgi:hypothetical protein
LFLCRRAVWLTPGAKGVRDPSLRLKNGYLQDDIQFKNQTILLLFPRYLYRRSYAKVFLHMAMSPLQPSDPAPTPGSFYCPNCAKEVDDPLTCGDCSAVICRRCGTPLESADELGMG